MKIYVNTAAQPPTLSASLNAKTDATGVLQVYNSSFGAGISQLKFKRGATVPLEFVFTDAAVADEIAKLRFGVKLAGRFDDVPVVVAETDDSEFAVGADGTTTFTLKLTFDAAVIDAALGVNSDAGDDVASAAFVAELEWENADGELTSTETVPATIFNNVLRGAGNGSGATAGEWTALMVIRLSWEEFSALTDKNPDAIYVVPDAPNEVEEHDASEDAHAERFAALEARLGAADDVVAGALNEHAEDTAQSLAELDARISSAEEDLAGVLREVPAATTTETGGIKLATAETMSVNDAAVGLDASGAARVASATAEVKGAVYLPASEASGLPNAAASLPVVRAKSNALAGGLAADADSSQADVWAYLGPLADLGVTGAAADLNTVTLYRRSGQIRTEQVYLRLLRKTTDADGNAAWQIVAQSDNAVSFAAQTVVGEPMPTFYMRRVEGVEPVSTTEPVAIVIVSAADAEASACLKYGCKMRNDVSGCLANLQIASALGMDRGAAAYAPRARFTWTPYAPTGTPTAAEFAALVARVAALESGEAVGV